VAILPSISGPGDIRALGERELFTLAEEIRETIIATVAKTGGHLGSSLGVVEVTLGQAAHVSGTLDARKDRHAGSSVRCSGVTLADGLRALGRSTTDVRDAVRTREEVGCRRTPGVGPA
jgi:hypothetical protein